MNPYEIREFLLGTKDDDYGIKLELQYFESKKDRHDFYQKLIELIQVDKPKCSWIILEKRDGYYQNSSENTMIIKNSIDPSGREKNVNHFFEFEN